MSDRELEQRCIKSISEALQDLKGLPAPPAPTLSPAEVERVEQAGREQEYSCVADLIKKMQGW